MITKTDYHLIMGLRSRYTPAQPGIVSAAEAELIRETLEISTRSNIELQNIRDVTVMLYGRWAAVQQEKDDASAAMELMDAMSAICCVIDQEKFNRGLDV